MTLRPFIVMLTLVAGAAGTLRSQTTAPQRSQWNAFLDDFLSDKRQPIDLTPQQFAGQLTRTKAQLEALRAIDPAQLSPDDALDRRFAESILVGRELEQERMRRWRMDPRLYTTALRTIVAQLGAEATDADRAARGTLLLTALKAVTAELRAGQNNLTLNVPLFQPESLALANAASTLLTTSLPKFVEAPSGQGAAILEANDVARESIKEWIDFLTTWLPKRPTGSYAVGIETYDAMLARMYLEPFDSDTLYQGATREFDRTVDELEAAANTIDPAKKWQTIATEAGAAAPPDASQPLRAYQEAILAARARLTAGNLIPVPWNERVDVVPAAKSLQDRAYAPAYSGATLRSTDNPLIGQWQIHHDDAVPAAFFGEQDTTVATVTAYAAYAEHALALYRLHNASRLRRALGSAMLDEGWGLYAEQLAQETGAFQDKRLHLRQLQLRLFAVARVLVDVGLHTRRMTELQATTLLTERLGLVKPAADLEIAAVADRPGAHVGYIGLVELLRLRDDAQGQLGDKFSLSAFHERLLKIGAMPPTLVRAALGR